MKTILLIAIGLSLTSIALAQKSKAHNKTRAKIVMNGIVVELMEPAKGSKLQCKAGRITATRERSNLKYNVLIELVRNGKTELRLTGDEATIENYDPRQLSVSISRSRSPIDLLLIKGRPM